MSESAGKTQALNWDEIDIDESVTDADVKKSEDISRKDPVGRFVCTVVEVVPRENVMKAYTCVQANLKFKIDQVILIEQPFIGADGKPFKDASTGEVVMKKLPVAPGKQSEIAALYNGRFISDGVNMFHPNEKEGMKNRRLFVAQKIGILSKGQSVLPGAAWKNAVGRQVIVETEWNEYTDKHDQKQKNVRVMWDGYKSAAGGSVVKEDDFSNI